MSLILVPLLTKRQNHTSLIRWQPCTLDGDGYYVVPGQGKYKITANGKDVDVEFIPEDNFLGTADGISIRRSDNNGYDTGGQQNSLTKKQTLMVS